QRPITITSKSDDSANDYNKGVLPHSSFCLLPFAFFLKAARLASLPPVSLPLRLPQAGTGTRTFLDRQCRRGNRGKSSVRRLEFRSGDPFPIAPSRGSVRSLSGWRPASL